MPSFSIIRGLSWSDYADAKFLFKFSITTLLAFSLNFLWQPYQDFSAYIFNTAVVIGTLVTILHIRFAYFFLRGGGVSRDFNAAR